MAKVTNFIMVKKDDIWLCKEVLDLRYSDLQFIKEHAEAGFEVIICHDIFEFMNDKDVTEYDIEFVEVK